MFKTRQRIILRDLLLQLAFWGLLATLTLFFTVPMVILIGLALCAFALIYTKKVMSSAVSFKSIITYMRIVAVIVVYYGILYSRMGLLDPEGDLIKGLGTGVYFSIVTWTTLGYGDLYPTPGICQFVVATEAIIGYLYMGILIALLLRWLGTGEGALQKLKPF